MTRRGLPTHVLARHVRATARGGVSGRAEIHERAGQLVVGTWIGAAVAQKSSQDDGRDHGDARTTALGHV